jgi:hypothetical protein
VLVLTALLYFSSSSFADDKTLSDGVMQIRMASEAPVIDGEMDDIWLTTTAEQMFFVEGDTTAARIFPYDDHYSAFRVLWDEDNFYVFMSVVDDSIKTELDAASPWLNDCVEIFFDGGNEKATSYDANDIQWRWAYGETPDVHPVSGTVPGVWAWALTSSGYNFELRIPADGLTTQFPLETDQEIGFEISNGDLETPTSPQTVLHWWTNNALTWNNPSLFGTAVLTDKEISSVLEIPYAEDTPTIDGVMEEGEGWELSDEQSLTRFEGAPDVYPQDSIFTEWKDHVGSFWTLWDDNYFYLFVRAIDDTIKVEAEAGSPWLNDCVEVFFDGGNEKATSYDANDIQWRWVYGETVENHPATGNAPGEWVWTVTDLGYDFELRIADTSLTAQFPLEVDQEIGFEVSNGDLETAASPQRVLHWWTNNGLTWNNPSLFGTALLVQEAGAVEEYSPIANSFKLEQNYPNPFNPTTNITYSVIKSDKVKLSVYNILGNEVAVLVDGSKAVGTYTISFDALNLPSGVYFYKLETGNNLLVKKMMLLK